MQEFRTRKTSEFHFFSSWLFVVILFVILVFFARGVYFSFVKKSFADQERERQETRFRELEAIEQELEENLEYLKTERGREEELRMRYNLTHDGETMIRIIE